MEDIVELILKEADHLTFLVVAYSWPAKLNTCTGSCYYIGNWSGIASAKFSDFTFHSARNSQQAVEGIRAVGNAHDKKTDVVIIDHDHSIHSVIDQYNAALSVSHKDTLFIFDDAVPRSIEMARNTPPATGWWVGQVWMLAALLTPIDNEGFVVCSDAGTTGAIVASRCYPIDREQATIKLQELQRIQEDLVSIQKLLAISSESTIVSALLRVLKKLRRVDLKEIFAAQDGEGIDLRVIMDPEIRRLHMPAHFVIDLSGRSHNLSQLLREYDFTPAKYLDTFHNVFVIKNGNIIKDSFFLRWNARHGDRDLLRIASAAKETYHYSGISEDEGRFFCKNSIFRSAISIDENVLMATPDEPDNWGMWLLYTIPAIVHFKDNRHLYSKLLICLHRSWQRSLIEFFEIDMSDIIPHDLTKSYFCSRMTLIRRSFRNLAVSNTDRAIFEMLGARARSATPGPVGEKVFISRRNYTAKGAYRGLQNEDELCNALERAGFRIVEPETMPFEQQIAIFHNASAVVGLGGAGMFNTIFCKPGTKVVTIESGLGYIGSHANIFATMQLPHGLIIGQEDLLDPRLEHKRWSLEVTPALNAINEFVFGG